MEPLPNEIFEARVNHAFEEAKNVYDGLKFKTITQLHDIDVEVRNIPEFAKGYMLAELMGVLRMVIYPFFEAVPQPEKDAMELKYTKKLMGYITEKTKTL